MMCGTQANRGGSSPRDNMGPENEDKFTELANQLKVQCLRETTVIPQRSTQGSAGYDISAAYSCVIPSKGKGVVQAGLATLLLLGVYAKIVPCLGLIVKKFIDMGARVINSDYLGEIGVVLFNHSAVDFPVQVGDKIAQLILEKIKTSAVQKVIVLSATDRGSGGFGSMGLQSNGSSNSVTQRKSGWKNEKGTKRENTRG